MAKFISRSREETLAFASEYAKSLRAGDVVILDGEMGAGKTVFAKGVAKGLGIDEEVTSRLVEVVRLYIRHVFSLFGRGLFCALSLRLELFVYPTLHNDSG